MTTIIEIILATYCIFFVSYTCIFVIAGHLHSENKLPKNPETYRRFAVLVPTYKCDEVILNSVQKNISIQYPTNHWKLFVIADQLKPETINQLKEMRVQVVEVNFEVSTKVRSLKKCLVEKSINSYDSIVILDADNIMSPNYLLYVNDRLNKERVVQGERRAANFNNALAVLDGISEALNNMVFRQGADTMGLSVSLSGSGMAFEKSSLIESLNKMDSIGGFDRELEYELLSVGIRSSYLKEAIIYDEKTDDMANFQNQRKRWISSQFVYLKRYFFKGIKALINGNIAYFHSTVLRNIQLPRILNIGIITVITATALILSTLDLWHWQFWLILWLIHTLAIFSSIPRNYYSLQLLKSLISLPGIAFSLLLLMFRLKGANKQFIHTTHKVRKDGQTNGSI